MIRRFLLLAVLPVLASCETWLPKSTAKSEFGWNDYTQAEYTMARIIPYESRRADLIELGLDPFRSANVTVLNYADLVQRFAVGTAVPIEQLDRGIADCLRAGKRCTGMSVVLKYLNKKRIGNFWLDSLNFRRETESTGWSFSALIVLVDDLVVYTLTGGQPSVRESDVVRNPLGPLQSWGEQLRPRP
jgi:hypothetical protein